MVVKRSSGFVLTIDSDDEGDSGAKVATSQSSKKQQQQQQRQQQAKPKGGLVQRRHEHHAQQQQRVKKKLGGSSDSESDGEEAAEIVESSAAMFAALEDSGSEPEEEGQNTSTEQGQKQTTQRSWDFSTMIADIKSKEDASTQAATSLDDKIEVALAARAQRQALEELEAERKKLEAGENHMDVDEDGDSEDADGEDDDDDDDDDDNDDGDGDGEGEGEGYGGAASGSVDDEDQEADDYSRQLGPNSAILKNKAKLERQLAASAAEVKAQGKKRASTFVELNLSRPLLRAVQALGFDRPTPIQARAIPFAMAGRDICGSAVTGSGKTAAFVLPVLERLLFRPKRIAATRVLIMTPTRELTQQVHSMLEKLGQFTDIQCCVVVGGLPMEEQAMELRGRPDVVVATPGRLIDHVRNTKSVDLDDVEILILDEADRLLEMGFLEEITEVVKFCPKDRQTLLFSATMTASVNELVELSLRRPVRVEADPLYDMATRLVQEFVRVKPAQEGDREAMLLALCSRSFKSHCIVFVSKKVTAHRLGIVFGLMGLKAAELHGNLTQRQRLESLQRFRDQEADFLLCTDLASRGLDIQGVEVVMNYEMPRDLATYVHRVGRTARAGRGGYALTLTGEAKRKLTKEVLKRSKKNVKSRTIPDKVVTGLRARIADYEPEVQAVLEQEKAERQFRLAEMEINKASNLMEHKQDIMSKPARSWFQTAREKQLLRLAKKEQHFSVERQSLGAAAKERAEMALQAELDAVQARKQRKEELKEMSLTRAQRRRKAWQADEEADRKEQVRALKKEKKAEGLRPAADELKLVRRSAETSALLGAKNAKKRSRDAMNNRAERTISKPAQSDIGQLAALDRGSDSAEAFAGDAGEAGDEGYYEGGHGDGHGHGEGEGEGEGGQRSRGSGKKPKLRAKFSGPNDFSAELAPGQGLALVSRGGKDKSGKGGKGKGGGAKVFKPVNLSKSGGLRKGGKLGVHKFKSKSKFKRRR